MADKVELTKEQLNELTEYFKQNDFTKNMMLAFCPVYNQRQISNWC